MGLAWAADVNSGFREILGLVPQGKGVLSQAMSGGWSGSGRGCGVLQRERDPPWPCCFLHLPGVRLRCDGVTKGHGGWRWGWGPWQHHPSPGTSRVPGDSSPRQGAVRVPSAPLFREVISLMGPGGADPHCPQRSSASPALTFSPFVPAWPRGPGGNYGLISGARPGCAPAGEQPHNGEPQMRGKAWPVAELPATGARVSRTPTAPAWPQRYFWLCYCARDYKAAAVAGGAGCCALAARWDMPQRHLAA